MKKNPAGRLRLAPRAFRRDAHPLVPLARAIEYEIDPLSDFRRQLGLKFV
jgi:hypothetical protein